MKIDLSHSFLFMRSSIPCMHCNACALKFNSCGTNLCSVLYYRRGPNKWRDQFLPVEILDEWIKAKGLPPAEWAKGGKSVTIGDQEYTLSHFGKHCN